MKPIRSSQVSLGNSPSLIRCSATAHFRWNFKVYYCHIRILRIHRGSATSVRALYAFPIQPRFLLFVGGDLSISDRDSLEKIPKLPDEGLASATTVLVVFKIEVLVGNELTETFHNMQDAWHRLWLSDLNKYLTGTLWYKTGQWPTIPIEKLGRSSHRLSSWTVHDLSDVLNY